MNAAKSTLPRALRVAMVVAITVSVIEVSQAANELAVVMSANELEMPDAAVPEMLSDAERAAARAANLAAFTVAKSTMQTMSGSRSFILLALTGCASMVFFSSLRLRWPVGASRSASARRMGAAAYATAVFRTLDGAQSLVIARRSAEAAAKAIEALASTPQLPAGLIAAIPTAMNVMLTGFMVTVLLVLGHYFRSDRVQTTFIALDGPEPEPDDE